MPKRTSKINFLYPVDMFRILFLLLLLGCTALSAQTKVDELLEKSMNLSTKSQNLNQLAEVLGATLKAVDLEIKTSGDDLQNLLKGEVGQLKGIIPMLLTGKVDLSAIGIALNRIKLVIGANRLRKQVASGVGANNKEIQGTLNLLKSGSSALGAAGNSEFTKLYNSSVKSIERLNKGGLFKKCKAKKVTKNLSKLAGFVSSSLEK